MNEGDLTTVMLESEDKRLLVASCYMSHDRPAPPDDSSLLQMPMHTTACGEAPTSTAEVSHS